MLFVHDSIRTLVDCTAPRMDNASTDRSRRDRLCSLAQCCCEERLSPYQQQYQRRKTTLVVAQFSTNTEMADGSDHSTSLTTDAVMLTSTFGESIEILKGTLAVPHDAISYRPGCAMTSVARAIELNSGRNEHMREIQNLQHETPPQQCAPTKLRVARCHSFLKIITFFF